MNEYICDDYLIKIDDLINEINIVAPAESIPHISFRSELAGLLVVAIAATYETCVKEIIIDYARFKHADFGGFAKNNFSKINSRISPKDLSNYCYTFSENLGKKFDSTISKKRKRISTATNVNFEKRYEQLLRWRHEYAHAAIKSTTIEEAQKYNRFAKHVLYAFEDTFRFEKNNAI
jgi:hypothetical protein